MKPKQLRKLARTDPEAFLKLVMGGRAREMRARHLLFHQDLIPAASESDLAALEEYLEDGTWRSLYGHDRAMYRLLRAAVEKLGRDKRPSRKDKLPTIRPSRKGKQ